MFPLDAVIRVARKAAQRRLIGAMLHFGSIGWAIGGAVGLVLVVLQKTIGGLVTDAQVPGVWVAIGAALVGLAAGAALALSRRLTLLQAAELVDQTLGLRSRLSTGLALAQSAGANDPAFVELSLRDSEAMAARVDARSAVPITLVPRMAVGPVLTVLAVLVALLAPPIDWTAEASGSGSPAAAEVSPVVEEVRAAAETLREVSRSPEIEAATQEQAELIDRLEQELLEGRKNPIEARAAAASSLHEAAEALEKSARERQRAADELRERLASRSKVEPESYAVDEIRELAERLREGDLERAAGAADALAERFASMTEEERAQAGEELRRLAEQLEPPPTEQPAEPSPPAGPTSPDEAQPMEGKPDTAPETTGAERDLRELAESLRRAADEPPPPPQPREEQQPSGGTPEPREPPQAPGETPPAGEPTPEAQPEPGEQPSQQPVPEQPPDRAPKPGVQQQPQASESPEPQQAPQPQPGNRPQEQEQPSGEPGETQSQPSGEGTPDKQPAYQPGAAERSPEPVPQPGEQPDHGAEPSEPSESPGSEEGSPDSGMARLTERLREMAKRRQDAHEMQKGADELRERAKRLLEGMGKGQREALERWAEQLERDAPPEWADPTETIDATGDATPGERVAGEWYGRGSDSPSPEQVAQRIMRARQGVERSIEQQTVPRRHADFLRRVFERYAERAQRP